MVAAVKQPLPAFLLFGLLVAASAAWADDDQLCFGRPGKDLPAAAKACTTILQRSLLTPEWKLRAFIARGRLNALQHQFESAIADFSAAVAADPEDRTARLDRAGTYAIMGQFRKAQQDTNILLQKTRAMRLC